VKALVFERNLPRFAASRVASLLGSGRGVGVGPLRLLDIEPPALPGPDWRRVTPVLSGICGSDLATGAVRGISRISSASRSSPVTRSSAGSTTTASRPTAGR
jgi:hypothetical protein